MNSIPTLQQIKNALVAAVEAGLGVALPSVGKNMLQVMTDVDAGQIKLLYLGLGDIQKNIFVDTADPEAMGGTLERFGRVKLGRNPFGPTAGQYYVTVTASQIGAIIPASSTWKSDDTSAAPGYLFILDNAFTFTQLTGTIVLRALTPGLESALAVGNTLTSTAPISLVNTAPSSASVSQIFLPPLAAEDIEDYRLKVENSYRLEAEGGAATDYRLWAADAQGCKQVYPYPTNGQTAEIDIYVEAYPVDSIDGYGTPTPQIMSDVAAVIEFSPDVTIPLNERGRRPMGVFQINYYTVTPLPVDIVINGLQNNSPQTQQTILQTITAALNITRPYVAAADTVDSKNDILDNNKLVSLIFTAKPGAQFNTVTFMVGGVPYTSFTFSAGFIPYTNSITYT